MQELRIDPEFQNKIPPLTDAEFEQLRENILSAGEVYEPLITWNGIIVDGHNRWKIIKDNPDIKWRSREMGFPNKWAAFDWMYKNQLGRRNLTEQQRTYLIGKMYEARKKSAGGDGTNQHTKEQCAQNGPIPKMRTREKLAEELGIGNGTIMRAKEYATGIDVIREQDPELANSILNGNQKADKAEVRNVGKASEEDRSVMIQQIKGGKKDERKATPLAVPDKIEAEKPKAITCGPTNNRIVHNHIVEVLESMYDKTPVKFTLNDLYDEIRWNAESYIGVLTHTLQDHPQLIEAYKDEIKAYIAENVTMKIKEIEEML